MVTISDRGSYRVNICPREHGSPHVHVTAPDFIAKVLIEDGTVIAGSLPAPARRRVFRWLAANRDMLTRHWAEITSPGTGPKLPASRTRNAQP